MSETEGKDLNPFETQRFNLHFMQWVQQEMESMISSLSEKDNIIKNQSQQIESLLQKHPQLQTIQNDPQDNGNFRYNNIQLDNLSMLDTMRRQLAESESRCLQLQSELTSMRGNNAQIRELKSTILRLRAEIQASRPLQQKLQSSESAMGSLHAKFSEIVTNNRQLQSDLKDMRESNKRLSDEVHRLTSRSYPTMTNEEYTTKESLMKENEKLRKQLEEITKELNELKRKDRSTSKSSTISNSLGWLNRKQLEENTTITTTTLKDSTISALQQIIIGLREEASEKDNKINELQLIMKSHRRDIEGVSDRSSAMSRMGSLTSVSSGGGEPMMPISRPHDEDVDWDYNGASSPTSSIPVR